MLDLAVRGKLVPQNPNDEPAAELLKRIAAEKARLVMAGEIRKQEPFDNSINIEGSFEIPESWEWVPALFPAYVVSDVDKKVQTKDVLETGKYPVVDQGKVFIRGYCDDDSRVIRVTAPLIVFGDHTRETKLINFDFVVGADGVKILQPVSLFTRYYYFALQWLPLDSRGYGRHFKLLRASFIPLPPLAEQQRIVAKVDELMVLCDRLEAARADREATRDKLTAASLARLDAPDPETFRDDARFALEALPALTARPDQIKQLRQAILNLAVRGKLVPQDPNNEPASELLKRIAKEKARLGIKSVLLPLEIAEIPFELPAGWSWSCIGEVCSKTGSGSTPRGGKEVYKKAGIPFLRSQNVYDDGLRLHDVAYIDPATHERMGGTRVLPRDLLLNITGGSIGRCCRVPDDLGEANVSQHVAILRAALRGMEDFLHRLVLSPYFQAFIFDEQTGAGRGGLPKNRMDQIAVALPPLAEQRRIVTKVDALMALCDRLEASLATADETRRRLLEALLAEALAPDEDRELEAAE